MNPNQQASVHDRRNITVQAVDNGIHNLAGSTHFPLIRPRDHESEACAENELLNPGGVSSHWWNAEGDAIALGQGSPEPSFKPGAGRATLLAVGT